MPPRKNDPAKPASQSELGTTRARSVASRKNKKAKSTKKHTKRSSTPHATSHHKTPSKHRGRSQTVSVINKMQDADMAVARATLLGMTEPFTYVPPAFGVPTGSMVSTSVSTYTLTIPVGQVGCAAFFPMPTNCFRTATAPLLSVPTWTVVPCVGGGAITTYSQGRLLAAGIRWNVRASEITVPGFVHGGLIPIVNGIADITSYSCSDMINTPNIIKIDGRTNLTGTATWRPVDSQDGQMTIYMGAGNTVVTSNAIYVAFSGWPDSTIINVEYVIHVEEQPFGSNWFGIGSSLSFADHDWSVVMDAVAALGGRAFLQVLQHGSKYVAHLALRAATAGWLDRGLRIANSNNESSPPPDSPGEYTPSYYTTVVEPAARRAREDYLEAQIRALGPESIDARVQAILASRLTPGGSPPDAPPTTTLVPVTAPPSSAADIAGQLAALQARVHAAMH